MLKINTIDSSAKTLLLFIVGFLFLFGISICSFFEIPLFQFYLFHTPISELKKWHPNFYFLIFILFQTLKLSPYIILGLQVGVFIVLNKANWLLKGFMLVNILLIFLFLTDYIWFPSFQLLILWLYYNSKNTSLASSVPNKKIRFSENWFLFSSFFVALSIRLIWILLTDNAGNGDATSRLYEIKLWTNTISNTSLGFSNFHPYYLLPSSNWLPLHYYIVSFFGRTTSDWIITPRIVSALFGALSVVFIYKITKIKFKNKRASIISSLFLVFYGTHIMLSSLVMSETLYIFFLIYTYYNVERLSIEYKNKYLIYVTLGLIFISWLRFEGWVVSFIIILYLALIFRGKHTRQYISLILVYTISIAYIMTLEVLLGNHPLHGILFSDYEVKLALKNKVLSPAEVFLEYIVTWIPFILISIMSFLSSKQNKQEKIKLFFLYLLITLPFIIKTMNGTLTSQSRYLTLYLVILIPYLSLFISKLTYSKSITFTFFMIPLLIFISNFSFIQYFKNNYSNYFYCEGHLKTASYMKNITECSVYIDTYHYSGELDWMNRAELKSSQYLKLNSKKEIETFYINYDAPNFFKRNVVGLVHLDSGKERIWKDSNFISLLKRKEITHIVLFPDGTLNNHLQFKNKIEYYKEYVFQKEFDFEGFYIYKIES